MAADRNEDSKVKDGSAVSEKVLFVRNLPFSTKDQDLENIFSDVGPIKRSFVIRDKDVKNSCRGFGYVTFALAEDAQRAIDVVKSFGGRQLSVCFANKKPKHEKRKRERELHPEVDNDDSQKNIEDEGLQTMALDENENETPPKKKLKSIDQEESVIKSQRREPKNDMGRTIKLTKLAEGLNQNHIRKKFRKIGPVEKVTFPAEGQDTSTAFVVYQTHKDAREAVRKLSGKIFKGNTIGVSLLSKEGKTPSQRSLKKSKLIVRNLSFKCNEEDLRKFFTQFGQISDVHIPTKMDGKRKRRLGFGFVQFRNVFEAAKAIKETNMKEIAGRPVAVDWALAKSDYKEKKGMEETQAEKKRVTDENTDDNQDEDISVDVSNDDSDVESDEEKSGSSDTGDDEEEEENEVSDQEHEQEEEASKAKKTKQPSDVKEGKTLFIRNISFDTSEESLYELFEQFGEVDYCKMVEDKRTGHSRGMAFVKFKTVEGAEKCLVEADKDGSGISLDNFKLNVTKAVTRGKAAELAKEKKLDGTKDTRDKRNLYLAKEGLITPGSEAAQGLSKADLVKRQKAEAEKKAKLENPNNFVSTTRLCVRNLPLNVDDKKLQEIFGTATGKRMRVKKVLIIRSKDRLDSTGRGRSMGYGFIEFTNHKDALAVLRVTNNNPAIFGPDRRPIVDFSIENSLVLKAKQRHVEKAQHKQQQSVDEHARDEQPKTNKERRLERNQKRREKRVRKREARKKRKLEEGKDGEGDKIAQERNKVIKAVNSSNLSSSKAKKFENLSRMDVTQSESKRGKKNVGRNKQSSLVLRNNSRTKVTSGTAPNVSPYLKMVSRASKERQDSEFKVSKTSDAPNRKRKGARKRQQEQNDESKFSQMVSKYKNKLFGMDNNESSLKRTRWFQ